MAQRVAIGIEHYNFATELLPIGHCYLGVSNTTFHEFTFSNG